LNTTAIAFAGSPRHRVLRAVLALLLPLAGLTAQAQVASLRTYGTADGLRSLGADCLVEDARGGVWACTYAGLYRYEGERFERVGKDAGLDDAYVMQAAPTLDGNAVWVATAGSLYYWDGDRATRILDPDGAVIPFSVGHTLAATPDGAVVLSRGRALRVWRDGQRWSVAPLFDGAVEMAQPAAKDLGAVYRDGRTLWFGCGQTICVRGGDGALRSFDKDAGVPADAWTSFLRDSQGTLWARGTSHVIALPPHAGHFQDRTPPAPSSLSSVTRHLDLSEDAQGRMLTRSDNGLLRWQGGQWHDFDTDNGLPDTPPNAVLATRDGELWLGYAGMGVLRWRGYEGVQNWAAANGLKGLPNWALVRDRQGAMLFGNERGIYRQAPAGGAIEPLRMRSGAPLRNVFGLTVGPDGAPWVALYGGQVLRADGLVLDQVAALPHKLRRFLFDRRGRLWLCTTQGVYFIDDLVHPQPRRFAGLPEVSFGDVAEDAQGRLWFAGKAGLMRVDGGTGAVTPLRVEGDLPNTLFDKLSLGKDGTLWVAVDDAGLFHGAITDGDTVRLAAVDDGLLKDSLPYFIRHDSKGRLWVGGSMGLDIQHDGRWTRLLENDGLISEDISEGAFFEDPDGSVWVGTSRGVSHLLHPDQLLARAPVELRITRVERGGRRIARGAVLGWQQQPVRVTLSTPGSTASQDMLRFRYRLRGRQDGWIETSSRTLDFPSMESGEQTIEVQALDLARRTQSPIVGFAFQIQPPWWRSVPALAAWFAMGFGLIGLVWHTRLRGVRARERELEGLVSVRTRELEADKFALEQVRAALQVQATHDGLTGLRNRASIIELLTEECRLAGQDGHPLAVALIDLDHFKQINDTHGHLAGDTVLVSVAHRLSRSMRGSDAVGRYGGEELLAVLPGLRQPAIARLDALHSSISNQPVDVDGLRLPVTSSIGVAWLRPGESPTALLRRADEALYQAKRGGRDQVVSDLDLVEA
jgi:diguanylate cyclase (GGDEF)-like protein